MKTALAAALMVALPGAAPAFAEDVAMSGRRAAPPTKEPWEFALTAYPTQVTWGRATIGGFWFNPGAGDQVFVASIGATF